MSDGEATFCGRCDRPVEGEFCACGFPNDPRSHAIERRMRELRAALRPHDEPSDRIGDVWVRGAPCYEGEPVEERTYTVGNIGGSEDELLFDDGIWRGEFDLIDEGFVRQSRGDS